MKFLLSISLSVACLFSANAQYDPVALEILNAMSAKYQALESFSANFTQDMVNEDAGINENIKGEIVVKGEKYLLKVAGQEIYNNGKDVFTYNPEMQEVTINTYEPEDQEITLSNVYDLYKNGFKYVLMSTSATGESIIELDPEDRAKTYYKIRMIIAKDNSLKKFTVFEKSGNQYVYTIQNFKERTGLTDKFFTFDTKKFPNVEVIDFR